MAGLRAARTVPGVSATPTRAAAVPGATDPAEGTPLRTPAALAALLEMLSDANLVHRLVAAFPTWETLAAADAADLGWHAGQVGAQLRFPPVCPPLPEMAVEVSAVSRYEPDYPALLHQMSAPPVLLFTRGRVPAAPGLLIGGADHPTPVALEVVQAAVAAAVAARVPVLAGTHNLIGMLALRGTVERGGVAVAAVAGGLNGAHPEGWVLDEVISCGGAVISAALPHRLPTPTSTDAATQMLVALAGAVVLAEVGLHEGAGAPLARAAISAGKFLIVPTPQLDLHLPASAAGGPPLAHPRAFSPSMFGTSARLAARIANGLSPADAVVSTPAELAEAIRLACRPI